MIIKSKISLFFVALVMSYSFTACSVVTPSVPANPGYTRSDSVPLPTRRSLPQVMKKTPAHVSSPRRPSVVKTQRPIVSEVRPKILKQAIPSRVISKVTPRRKEKKVIVHARTVQKKVVAKPRRKVPVMQAKNPYEELPKPQNKRGKASIGSSATQVLIMQAQQAVVGQQYSTAISYLERALRIEPQNAAIWSELAKVHYDKGSDLRAISMAKKSNLYSPEGSALELQNWNLIRMASKRSGNVQSLKDALRYERSRS